MNKPPRHPHGSHGPRHPQRPSDAGARTGEPRGPEGSAQGDRGRHRRRDHHRGPRQPGMGQATAGPERAHGTPRADAHHGHPQGNTAGRDLIFGVEPVRELLAAAPGAIRTLYVKAGAEARFADELDAARIQGATVVPSEDGVLARMAGSEARHQGLVAIMREYEYAPFDELIAEEHDPLIVIDGVTDPRNLGAIMRSAECAGARGIVIARDRTVGITPITIKASAGAWAHLRIARCGNVAQALEALKHAGYWVVALAPAGDVSIYDLDTSRRLAFVLGSEGRGVREIVRKSADFVAGIPMRGRIDSLNVAVAAAVALFEVARHRAAAPQPASA